MGQAEGDAHGQAFRHGDDDDGHGDHEIMQQLNAGFGGQPVGKVGGEGAAEAGEEEQSGGEGQGGADGDGPARLGEAFRAEGQHGAPDGGERDESGGAERGDGPPLSTGEREGAAEGTLEDKGEIDQGGDGQTDDTDEAAEAFELGSEGGIFALGWRGAALQNAGDVGAIAHGAEAQGGAAIDDEGAAEDVITGEGDVFERCRGGGFRGHFADRDGFAGEARFVDAQGECSEHFGIGGDAGAALDEDDIAHDEFMAGEFDDGAFAADDDEGFVIDLAEQVEFAAGAVLVEEAEGGGEENGEEDAEGFEEVAFDGADGEGDEGGEAEDADDGVVEFAQVEAPPGGTRRWGDAVGAVFGAAGGDFRCAEARDVTGWHEGS